MINEIPRLIAGGELCRPSYIAFPVAQLQEEPWKPKLPTHDRPDDDWGKRTTGSAHLQLFPTQAYILYSLRFIFSAHMVLAWEPFGGIPDQFNALASDLNLSIVENSGGDIEYDLAIRKQCADLARRRRSSIDFDRLLSQEQAEIKKHVIAHRTAPPAHAGDPPNQIRRKGKGKRQESGLEQATSPETP